MINNIKHSLLLHGFVYGVFITIISFTEIFNETIHIPRFEVYDEIKITGGPRKNIQTHRNASGQHVRYILTIQYIRYFIKKRYHAKASYFNS